MILVENEEFIDDKGEHRAGGRIAGEYEERAGSRERERERYDRERDSWEREFSKERSSRDRERDLEWERERALEWERERERDWDREFEWDQGGATSYHHNRRPPPGRHHERDRYERERYDRLDRERERERERLHARERDLMHYGDELLEHRAYGADYLPPRTGPSGAPHHLTRAGRIIDESELLPERDPRYPPQAAPLPSSRIDPRDLPPSAPTLRRGAPIIDRDEYSPHRSSGSSRRMLNAM